MCEAYLAVLDMAAEFYLDTVQIVFQESRLARGEWRVQGHAVRPQDIRTTALQTSEAEQDAILGCGQTRAAHALRPPLGVGIEYRLNQAVLKPWEAKVRGQPADHRGLRRALPPIRIRLVGAGSPSLASREIAAKAGTVAWQTARTCSGCASIQRMKACGWATQSSRWNGPFASGTWRASYQSVTYTTCSGSNDVPPAGRTEQHRWSRLPRGGVKRGWIGGEAQQAAKWLF